MSKLPLFLDNGPIDLILDTDPGRDDCAAILMALGLEKMGKLKLRAITCVAGNVPLELTQKNTRIICDWANREDLLVFQGASQPILKKLITAEYIHGKNGLEGATLHTPTTPLQEKNAILYLIETLTNVKENSVTVCCIGPLTNLALAITTEPLCMKGIKEVVIMGGSYFEVGNITPNAEFNFYVDPHAVKIIINSGMNISIIPLDVTHRVCLTTERQNQLKNLNTKNGKRLASILNFHEDHPNIKNPPLHDPCAIAFAVSPHLFSKKKVSVNIETQSPLMEGTISIDWHHKKQQKENVTWSYDIDSNLFFSLFNQSISTLP